MMAINAEMIANNNCPYFNRNDNIIKPTCNIPKERPC